MSSNKVKRICSWDENLPIPNISNRASILLISFLSIGCYVISVDGDFVFDDTEAIVNNKDVRSDTPLSKLFSDDFWGTSMMHNESHKSYRPITILSFRLNVWFNDGVLSSYQFRLFNILFHCIVCLLSRKVFEMLMGGNCSKAATFCSVLFSVHPIHTEAVASIVGRAELLSTLFSFLCLYVYNKAVVSENVFRSVIFTLLSVLFVSLAMFSKEQGITMLGICFVYDMWVINRKHIREYLIQFCDKRVNNVIRNEADAFRVVSKCSGNVKKSRSKEPVYLMTVRFLLLFASAVSLLYVRWMLMGGRPPTFQKVDNHAAFIDNILFRVINYNYVYALHAWLLLCPIWLCFDWSMGCVSIIDNLTDVRLIVVIVFWAILLSIAYQNFQFSNYNTSRNVITSLAFIVITFLPASNLFFKVGFVVAERVLYLPSVGYCILIASGLQRLVESVKRDTHTYQYSSCIYTLQTMFWLFVIAAYVARSIQRSSDWRTEKALFESALPVCPLNAKVHYNLGKVADNKTLSLNHYRDAIRLNPEYDQAMNNLANLLKDDGNFDEAEELLRKSIQLRPNFAAAWMNLGIVLSGKKQHAEAEYCFMQAIQFRKHYPDCYYNLGNLYLDQKRYNEASVSWRKATTQKLSHSVAWNNLIIMLDSIGKYKEAESTALEALYTLPLDPGIHFNLANTLGKLSRFVEAEKHFKIAIEINSNQALYYVNLGVLYHRWKKHNEAKEMYNKALQISPKLESASRNLKMLP